MLEALMAGTATAGLFALAKGIKGRRRFETDRRPALVTEERSDDLPCPWCYGPTDEDDPRCPGCGRNFG